MISRRSLLKGAGLKSAGIIAAAVSSLGGYAIAFEPMRHRVTRYALTPPNWTPGLKLKLAVLADIHACHPWMSADRIHSIVAKTNALNPDMTLLLGDFVAGRRLSGYSSPVPTRDWSGALADLKAPLGVHAVLGNHDWWEDDEAQRTRRGPTLIHRALLDVGIPVYENNAKSFVKNGHPFWLIGLGDQWAFINRRGNSSAPRWTRYEGRHDLPETLAQVSSAAPIICMAHEPDIFASMPHRVALTLSGHTHGGQVSVLGYAPLVPSRYGQRYRYGHIVEDNRSLIVSAGLGCSNVPVRFGAPPEIVLIELG